MRRGIQNLWSAALPAVMIAVLLSMAGAASAQTELTAELEAAANQHFRLLPLQDGWLLEPLDESLGIRIIELSGAGIALDGVTVSEDELEARLGALAGVVLDVSRASAASASATMAVGDTDAAEEPASEDVSERIGREDREERARERRKRRRTRTDTQVVVGNDLEVEEDEVYRDVVVFGGTLTVDGKVLGDAVAIGGSAQVSGEVTGDLAVVGGSIELEDGAQILGDVVSVGGQIEESGDVDVVGEVVEVPFSPSFAFRGLKDWDWNWDFDFDSDGAHRVRHWNDGVRWFGFFDAGWDLVGVLFLALLACLVLVVARNPVERIAWKAGAEPLKAGLVGLLTQILCLPALVLVCLLLLISIVGIPLLLLVPFAILGFVLVAFVGYTAVAYRLGGWLEDRFGFDFGNPYMNLLVGVAAIEIWALVGELLSFGPGPIRLFAFMFGVFGCLVIYLAWTVGLGAAILTRVGTWDDLSGPGAAPGGPPVPPELDPSGPEWDLGQGDLSKGATVPDEPNLSTPPSADPDLDVGIEPESTDGEPDR